MFQTDFEFTLPCGYLDAEGNLHREGVMRRARGEDEILPAGDPRVLKNPSYIVPILLSRVVIRLGTVTQINPKVIHDLFVSDLAFLQELYNDINRLEPKRNIVCPHCREEFPLESNGSGG